MRTATSADHLCPPLSEAFLEIPKNPCRSSSIHSRGTWWLQLQGPWSQSQMSHHFHLATSASPTGSGTASRPSWDACCFEQTQNLEAVPTPCCAHSCPIFTLMGTVFSGGPQASSLRRETHEANEPALPTDLNVTHSLPRWMIL